MLKNKAKNGIIFHVGQSFTIMNLLKLLSLLSILLWEREEDMKENTLFRIKDVIKDKQEELDELLSNDQVDKNKALELSVELDKLIYKYYCLANSE